MPNSFVTAALEVLRRARRPMHYENITKTAIKLGLLRTTTRTPAISMSTALSAELSSPGTLLVREKPGVYSLRLPAYQQSMLWGLGSFIANLRESCQKLHRYSDVSSLLRKALYILQRAHEIAGPDGTLEAVGPSQTTILRLDSLTDVVNIGAGNEHQEALSQSVLDRAAQLTVAYGYSDEIATVVTSLRLLAQLIKLAGSRNTITIRADQRQATIAL